MKTSRWPKFRFLFCPHNRNRIAVPSAARRWGQSATILGTKQSILAAVTPASKTADSLGKLQGLFGVFPQITKSPNNLGISLRTPGQVIHPGVMYGRWSPEAGWDGKPKDTSE